MVTKPTTKVYYRLPMTNTALNMLIFRSYQQHSSALLNEQKRTIDASTHRLSRLARLGVPAFGSSM